MEKIRAFIAIEISEEARAEFGRIISELKKADAPVKWVDPSTVHLTLKFLGGVPREKVPDIVRRLEDAARGNSPFDIDLDGMGVFPNWGRAAVIWVGLGEGSGRVKEMALAVDIAMLEEGFERENRDFKPHLTLGRIKGARNKDRLREIMEDTRIKPVSVHVPGIILFSSELTPDGAVHTPISEIHLKG